MMSLLPRIHGVFAFMKYIKNIFLSIFKPNSITSNIDFIRIKKILRNEVISEIRKDEQRRYNEALDLLQEKQWLDTSLIPSNYREPFMSMPIRENYVVGLNDFNPNEQVTYKGREVGQIRISLERCPPEVLRRAASEKLAEHLLKNGFIGADMSYNERQVFFYFNFIKCWF